MRRGSGSLLDDTPITAAGTPDLRQGGNPALGVAEADPREREHHGLGRELVAAKLRNALTILLAGQDLHDLVVFPGTSTPGGIGFQRSDIEDLRRLVVGALEQSEAEALEHKQTRRNLAIAMAKVRRLEFSVATTLPGMRAAISRSAELAAAEAGA